jgi:hypothetical protein
MYPSHMDWTTTVHGVRTHWNPGFILLRRGGWQVGCGLGGGVVAVGDVGDGEDDTDGGQGG